MATEALTDTRVVVVNGARQAGKSTLAELIVARSAGARELYLDDQAVRAAAEADPSAFVRLPQYFDIGTGVRTSVRQYLDFICGRKNSCPQHLAQLIPSRKWWASAAAITPGRRPT